MDVEYVEKGELGKTCADCKAYQDKGDGKGECSGYEVAAQGSSNMFHAK